MMLLPTFGFKGTILPVLDKNEQLHLFIKNGCGHRVLLNVVTFKTNKFVNLEKDESKLVGVGEYQQDLQIKVFYMGHELFDFLTRDIDKQSLSLFSDYIIKTNESETIISISVAMLDGVRIHAISEKPQYLYVKLVDIKTNEIVHENVFISNEPYVFKPKIISNFEITILDSKGQKIHQQDI